MFTYIDSSISNNSVSYKYIFFIYSQLNVKTVLFQIIPFSMSTQFSSIWPIDRTLSDATTPGQSGSCSDGSEEVLRISQSYSITGTSPLNCLSSYTGHSLGGSYCSAKKQLVYSTAPVNWAGFFRFVHSPYINFPYTFTHTYRPIVTVIILVNKIADLSSNSIWYYKYLLRPEKNQKSIYSPFLLLYVTRKAWWGF